MKTVDVIVIGAGPAGEVVAGKLAEHGREVLIVEEHLVGGECSFYACMPSKALLRPVEVLAEARRIPGALEVTTSEHPQTAAVLARRDEIIHDLDDASQVPWLEDRGITLVRGHGEVSGERRVTVGDDEYEARTAVVLATGSLSALPDIPGLKEAKPWTNREATTAKRPPERLVVLGGGVVGVELSQAWQSLGSQVTLIEGERHVLPREEIFACEQVSDALTEMGVDIRTGQKATGVTRADGVVRVELGDGSSAEGDVVLAALGRRPRAGDVGLEAAGLEPDQPVAAAPDGSIDGVPWLYAIGDLNGRAPYTHMGKYQARLCADALLGRGTTLPPVDVDGIRAPRVIFTDPQVAAVGYTTQTAGEAGIEVRVVDVPTGGNAGGSFFGRGAPGTSRILIDPARQTIVGATFTGPDVAELLHAATVAIVGEVPVDRLRHAVPPFPTRLELWLGVLEQLDG